MATAVRPRSAFASARAMTRPPPHPQDPLMQNEPEECVE